MTDSFVLSISFTAAFDQLFLRDIRIKLPLLEAGCSTGADLDTGVLYFRNVEQTLL